MKLRLFGAIAVACLVAAIVRETVAGSATAVDAGESQRDFSLARFWPHAARVELKMEPPESARVQELALHQQDAQRKTEEPARAAASASSADSAEGEVAAKLLIEQARVLRNQSRASGGGQSAAAGQNSVSNPPAVYAPSQEYASGLAAYSLQVGETGKSVFEERKLEREVARLTGLLRDEADTQKKVELAGKIEGLLVQQFDLRQKTREDELRGLEERVKKLRENFDKRQKAKPEIVRHKLEEIVRNAEGMGWGEDGDVDHGSNKDAFFRSSRGGLPFGPAGGLFAPAAPAPVNPPAPVVAPAPPASPPSTR